MKAVCWNGVNELTVERVPDPGIVNPTDALMKVRLTTICGSDLHLLDGFIPTMAKGDVIGHEFMGEIVDTGREVKKLKKGDRAVVISIIGCGHCWYCQNNLWSLCDNSNPGAWMAEKLWGDATAGIFGYSHLTGGYAGSHAEYIRIPMADQGCFKVPDEITDEQVLFVSDAAATGYMAADMCGIKRGDTVAVWGCGGVGQMAIRSAQLLGAERVIAIDKLDYRLNLARSKAGAAETINFEGTDVLEALHEMTGGRGPDCCIDAVGMEADSTGIEYAYDRAKTAMALETDRPYVLRQIIRACRKGGTLSIVGVYGGFIDKFPMGALMNKALTVRTGQQHGQRYAERLIEHVRKGELDCTYLISHRMTLDEAPGAYQMFKKKNDGVLRPVFAPGGWGRA